MIKSLFICALVLGIAYASLSDEGEVIAKLTHLE